MKKGRWTIEEVEYVRESYEKGISAKDIGEALGRTERAVQKKASDNGIKSSKRWTEEQEVFLRKNYDELGVEGCAEVLKRTQNSVFEKATKLGLRKPVINKPWTVDEDNFLRENYTSLGVEKCAEFLERTYHSVQHRATRVLNIRHYRHVPWTDEEKDFLRKYYPTKLGHWCAEQLDRGFHAVHKMVEKLGIKPDWNYRFYNEHGYVVLCHDRENRIFEHRYVVEEFLGRKLNSEEVIHHINEIKDDNRLENLMITDHYEHAKLHAMPLAERRKIEEARKLG